MAHRQFLSAIAAKGATTSAYAYDPARTSLAQAVYTLRRSSGVIFVLPPNAMVDRMLEMADARA